MSDSIYWLLEQDPAKVAAEMTSRIERYAERMETSGRASIWRRMSRLFFSRDLESGLSAQRVSEGGEQGEYIGTRDNYLGRLVRQNRTMVTSMRPTFTARSIGDGSDCIQQVNASDKLMDFMISKRNAEKAFKRAELYMSLYGMGWVAVTWDERTGRKLGTELLDERGEPILDDQGQPMLFDPKTMELPPGAHTRDRFEGDIRFAAKRPDEVVYDVDLDETCEHEWLIVARQVSRWKLAQQYPEKADYIKNTDTFTRLDKLRQDMRLDGTNQRRANNDMVTVYDLFVPPNPLMPDGRFATLLGAELVADDRAIYDDFAHYEMTAEYEPGTRNGHSPLWDLCGLQQCADSAGVAITSTTENTGKAVLFLPEGADLDTTKEAMVLPFHVVRGTVAPQFITTGGAAALEPLMAVKGMHQDSMTQLAGVSDMVMGNVAGTPSGESLKTMSALAQQSVSDFQEAYADASCRAMFGGLKRYRTFASEDVLVQICGKGRAGDARAFKDDLGFIDGIDAELGPAELRFSAGKRAFADKMWESGAIKTPEQYLEAQATGKVAPILERPQSQRKLAEAENEELRKGLGVVVADTDDHRCHILTHSVVTDDISIRRPVTNPDGSPKLEPQVGPDGLPLIDPMTGQPVMAPALHPVMRVTAEHIMKHLEAIRGMDPDLASALSTEPVPGQVLAQQSGIQQQANAMQEQNAQPGAAMPNEVPPPGEGENINPAGMPA